MTRLADVVEINPRLDRSLLDDMSEAVSFVPMANVSEMLGAITSEESRNVSEVIKGFTAFKDRDVLVAKITPCFENGKIAHARITKRLGFGSTEFHVIRPRPGNLDDRYLYHFLRQSIVRAEGERRMTGSAGQKRVPKIFLEELNISLPPLPEQRRIAAILDKADVLRAKRREAIAKLDQLLQSVFLDMFGDPVTNSKGWLDTVCLGDTADICSGITKGRRTTDEVRGVPYLAVANVQDRHLKLGAVKIIKATEAEIDRYRLAYNDLLLTEGGDPDKLGRGALWDGSIEDCIHQNHVFRVRVTSSSVNPVYLNWLVGSARGKQYFLRMSKQTTGIASINITQLKSFPLLMPPIELQEQFSEIVSIIEMHRQGLKQSEDGFDKLFHSLQQQAFAGTL